MFWLVETDTQLQELRFELGAELLTIPIYKHPDLHPAIQDPICLYVRDTGSKKGFLINISHPEGLALEADKVRNVLTAAKLIYTLDRKAFNYFYFTDKSVDLNFIEHKKATNTSAHNFYSQKYHAISELGSIIPVVKHYEQCEDLFEEVQSLFKQYQPNQYYQDLTDAFWFVERNGLKINSAFEKYFELERPFLSRTKTYTFSNYNLYTTTGRPSNTFNTLNYAALNKDNGCRSVFIPRNDFLLEIDLTAYHPTLIAGLVGYESPTGDIYKDFAQEFALDRAEAKNLVFRQLYGNIYDQYKDFEFFKLTKSFVEQLWANYMESGEAIGIISGQKFSAKKLENMNPAKLFNYIIQNLETANNVAVLKDILTILNGKKTKMILYTYDAFLFDFSKEEKFVLQEVLSIFSQRNLNVKISHGPNYDSLQSL